MRQGADDARAAIQTVKTAAQDGGASVAQFSQSLSGGGSGGVGIAQAAISGRAALSQMAAVLAGFASLRFISQQFDSSADSITKFSNIAFATSHVLLDFERASDDFRRVRLDQAANTANTAFAGLSNTLKTSPLLIISVVLAGASLAMSLFAGKTKDAADESVKLAEAQKLVADQARQTTLALAERQVRGTIGVAPSGPSTAADLKQQVDELVKFAAQIRESGADSFNKRRVQEAIGYGGQGAVADQFLASQGLPTSISEDYSRAQAQALVEGRARRLQEQARQQQSEENLAEQRRRNPAARAGGATVAGQQSDVDEYLANIRQGTQLLALDEKQREQNIAVINAEQFAKQRGLGITVEEKQAIRDQIALQQQLNELRETGTAVGEAIGTAFFSIVNGAASARQALASLLQSFVALAQNNAIKSLGNLFGQFGTTLAQGPVSGPVDPATGSRG
jgi:hypothetical protein